MTERKNNRVTISTTIDKTIALNFDKLYPHCRARFIQNCMDMATNSRKFFDRTFFRDIIQSDDSSFDII